MNNNNNNNLGLHLKYVVVIFIVFTCIVGGLALYNQKLAVTGLSNAGLLLSIVLAVIAILITLWDVAGQRNTVSTIITVTQSLDNASKDIVENVSSFKGAVESVLEMKEKLENTMDSIKKSVEELEYKIDQNEQPDILKKELQEFKNKIKTIETSDISQITKKEMYEKFNKTKTDTDKILDMINKGQIPKIFSIKDIVNKMLDMNIDFSTKSLDENLKFLIKVEEIRQDKDGKYHKINSNF